VYSVLILNGRVHKYEPKIIIICNVSETPETHAKDASPFAFHVLGVMFRVPLVLVFCACMMHLHSKNLGKSVYSVCSFSSHEQLQLVFLWTLAAQSRTQPHSRAEPHRAAQSHTDPHRAAQSHTDRTVPHSAEGSHTELHRAAQLRRAAQRVAQSSLRGAAQSSLRRAAHSRAEQHKAAQSRGGPRKAAQSRTEPYRAVQNRTDRAAQQPHSAA